MTGKPTKIILHTPLENPALLEGFVERCVADGVELIAVFGDDSEAIHDLIDDIIIGDGSDETRFITTTWHNDEPLADLIEFVVIFGNRNGLIEQIRL